MTEPDDLRGKTALVTGATGGLGLEVATSLAARGARVLVGARNPDRVATALDRIQETARGQAPELVTLDLASLTSVRAAVDDVRSRAVDGLDLLVNNGGIMAPPRSFSTDGFELQWATNVLGPAALTWQLLPLIERAHGRVTWVASTRHLSATLTEQQMRSDVRGENYRGFDFYGRTKLADLLLSHELSAHFARGGTGAVSVAAHPGFTATGIVEAGFAGLPKALRPIANWGARTLGQPITAGALPILVAATASGVDNDAYFGPLALGGLRGRPGPAKRSAQSEDDATGGMLVKIVSELIGITAPQ